MGFFMSSPADVDETLLKCSKRVSAQLFSTATELDQCSIPERMTLMNRFLLRNQISPIARDHGERRTPEVRFFLVNQKHLVLD